MASYTYLGPYDELTVDGKTVKKGDKLTLSKERFDEINRPGDRYNWEEVDAPNAVPVDATVEIDQAVHNLKAPAEAEGRSKP